MTDRAMSPMAGHFIANRVYWLIARLPCTAMKSFHTVCALRMVRCINTCVYLIKSMWFVVILENNGNCNGVVQTVGHMAVACALIDRSVLGCGQVDDLAWMLLTLHDLMDRREEREVLLPTLRSEYVLHFVRSERALQLLSVEQLLLDLRERTARVRRHVRFCTLSIATTCNTSSTHIHTHTQHSTHEYIRSDGLMLTLMRYHSM